MRVLAYQNHLDLLAGQDIKHQQLGIWDEPGYLCIQNVFGQNI